MSAKPLRPSVPPLRCSMNFYALKPWPLFRITELSKNLSLLSSVTYPLFSRHPVRPPLIVWLMKASHMKQFSKNISRRRPPFLGLTLSREKLLPLAPKKPITSPGPALLFIGGTETPPNACFFPPIPPFLRPRPSAILNFSTFSPAFPARQFLSRHRGL